MPIVTGFRRSFPNPFRVGRQVQKAICIALLQDVKCSQPQKTHSFCGRGRRRVKDYWRGWLSVLQFFEQPRRGSPIRQWKTDQNDIEILVLQGSQPIQGAVYRGELNASLVHDIAGVLSDP